MVVLLRRFRANQPAPPRRGAVQVSIPPLRIHKPPSSSPGPLAVDRTVSADPFNAPLHGFKAFAIATTLVISSAAASVAGTMAYLGVRDTTEFAARARMLVSQSMPLLTEKIYRRPTSSLDSVPGDPVLIVALASQNLSTPTTFDHDAAQQRLSEAFDEGGFDTWAEAFAKEMEAEMEVERSRKIRAS